MASTGLSSSAPEADATTRPGTDILVAVTSHNDVRTAGGVTTAVREGLSRYFGATEARIVLADAGSTDGTLDAIRERAGAAAVIEMEPVPATGFTAIPFHGQRARAATLRAILQTAQNMGARACAFVDAGLETLEPYWLERLIAPVLNDGFDYVSPYYVRRLNEGAITKAIVYPMFRALYGVRMRQPAASEFGCSLRMVSHYLEQDFWEVEGADVGVDLWLSAAAASGEFRSCEAVLGARVAGSRGAAADLSSTLAQIVGALFTDLEHRVDVWQRARGSIPIPIVGAAPVALDDATAGSAEALIESFRLGYRELREIWTWVLPPRTIVELRKLTESPHGRLHFNDRFWASIVYDFALGHSLRVMPRDHLLRSLTPLYSGWLASFVLEMQGATLDQIEERIEQVCLGFEIEKRHLIARWRWPERLR